MTERETTDVPANFQSTAEDEVKAVKEVKEKINATQKEISENRSKDGVRARDSTGINPKDRGPINLKMPEMPPS